MNEGELRLEDSITGGGDHVVEIYFHFYPDLRLDAAGKSIFSVLDKTDVVVATMHLDAKMLWHVESGFWHPRFGVSEANVRLRGEYHGSLPVVLLTRIVWRT